MRSPFRRPLAFAFAACLLSACAPGTNAPCAGRGCGPEDAGSVPPGIDAGTPPPNDGGAAPDDAGSPPPGSDAGVPAAPVDCAGLAAAGYEVCGAFVDACEIVFRDSAGCDAACAAAGLRCGDSFEDQDGACAPDRPRGSLGCADTGHMSDYCVCVSEECTPSCGGRVCGSDGCGGSCGTCDGGSGDTCTSAGTCACVPAATCDDAAFSCGMSDDGCGGTLSCAAVCPDGYACAGGRCAPTARCEAGNCPAFPGAEGFGWDARGGRGGDVCHVTNTDDTGSGSLRACLSGVSGPRTVVFDIGGEIDLRSTLRANASNLTIAGQTAPGDGITITGYDVRVSGDHNIIQHLRFRSGDRRKKTSSRDGHTEDSLMIGGQHVIVDHVSASWGIDENLSTESSDWDRITVQNCIISEGLRRTRLFHGEYDSSHPGHSMGGLFKTRGRDHAHITIHHTLFAHNNNRNPAIGSYSTSEAQTADIRNNVIYNGGGGMGYTSGDSRWLHVNYVGNYGIWGRDTSTDTMFRCNSDNNVDIYYSGNYADRDRDGRHDGSSTSGVGGDYDRRDSAFDVPAVTTQSAPDALSLVLDTAGARPWNRDSVDLRVVRDVRSGSGEIVDSVSEAGGYPSVAAGTRVVDSDRDGVPDAFERAYGTDPNRADQNGDVDGDGYTNLENYLHWAARPLR